MKMQLPQGAGLELGRNQSVAILDGAGLELRVASGHVWLTQERDRRDILLRANETFRLDRPGLAILRAFVASRIDIATGRATPEAQHANKLANALLAKDWFDYYVEARRLQAQAWTQWVGFLVSRLRAWFRARR
jgi:hypothetical protein